MIKKLFVQAWNAALEAFHHDGGDNWIKSGTRMTPCEMKAMREQHVNLVQKIDASSSTEPPLSSSHSSLEHDDPPTF